MSGAGRRPVGSWRTASGRVAVGVTLAASLLVTGCSSSGSPAGSATTSGGASTVTAPAPASTDDSGGGSQTSGSSTSTAPSPTGSDDSGGSHSTSPSSGGGSSVPRCTFGQLTVRLGPSEGAAGSIYQPVVFHNTGAPCVLDGHPGMDATGPGGTVHAARDGRSSTGSSAVSRVVLARGGDASALVRASDVATGSGPCPGDFTSLLVTPPDLRQSARLAATLPACPGLTIGPVVAGTSG